MEQCAQCGQQGGADAIRLCSACKAIGYCSRDCQKRHWSRHKTECVMTMTMDKSPPDKDSSQQTSERRTKAAEKMTSPSGDGGSDSVPLPTCHKCGLQRQGMNRCGSCREVTYCSRDCQRANWKAHQAICRAVDKSATEGDKPTPPKEAAARTRETERTDPNTEEESLSSSVNKMHLTSPDSWEDARSRAARLYPGHRIVDKFEELDKDWMGEVKTDRVVAVVRIAAPYAHYFWHGRFLEDVDGNASFVLFHTPKDPRPHFRYEQLREGNFLCYQHAFLHFFRDKSVGFRIDEARDVRILELLKDTSKDTSTAPCHSPTSTAPPTLTTPQQWEQARSETRTMFPEDRVVDSLQDMDHQSLSSFSSLLPLDGPEWAYEIIGKPLLDEGKVKETLLVLLQAPVSFSLFHSWLVKDRRGKSAQLKFELTDWSVPLFRFEDLQKGHFMYVCQPHVILQKECYTICAKTASSVGIVRP